MAQLGQGGGISATSWLPVGPTTNNQRAWGLSSFVPLESGFLTHLGARLRRSGANNGRAQIAIWADSDGVPGDLLGYGVQHVVSSGSSSAGIDYVSTISWSAAGAAISQPTAAPRVFQGVRYWLGLKVTNNGVDVGQIAGAQSSQQVTGGGGLPTTPFGTGTTLATQTPLLWATVQSNRNPSLVLGGPSGSGSSLFPTFGGTITDLDSGAPYYDRLNWVNIQVRQVGQTALLWNLQALARDDERNAGAFSRQYEGAALSPFVNYEWRAQVRDDLLGYSTAMVTWQPFSVEGVGSVATPSLPTGKEPDGIITTWSSQWLHGGGQSMTHAQVEVFAAGTEQRVYLSPEIAKAATATSFFTLTSAEVGFGTAVNPVPPGDYTFRMRGRAADGGLTAWSARGSFRINSAPNQPSGLTPVSGSRTSEFPVFRFRYSDNDIEDVPGATVTATVRITRPDGVITEHATSLIDPATGEGYLVGDSGNLPLNGTYTWDVKANDGLVDGPWSAPANLVMVVAPSAYIDLPAQNATFSTSTPQVEFGVAIGGISRFQIRLYRPGVLQPFFASPMTEVEGAPLEYVYQIPPGWLENGSTYQVDALVVTPDNLTAISDRKRFTITYTAADIVNGVTAAPTINTRSYEPDAIAVSWLRSGANVPLFRGYAVWRRLADESPETAAPVAFLTSPDSRTWVDYNPPPNVDLIYSVTQYIADADGNVRQSPHAERPTRLTLTTPVIASAIGERGATHRISVVNLETGLGGGFRRKDATFETWGSEGAPLWARNPDNYGADNISVAFTIRADGRGTLDEHFQDAERLVKSGDVLGVRLEHQRGFYRIVPGKWWSRGDAPGTIDIQFSLEEVYHREAVDITV